MIPARAIRLQFKDVQLRSEIELGIIAWTQIELLRNRIQELESMVANERTVQEARAKEADELLTQQLEMEKNLQDELGEAQRQVHGYQEMIILLSKASQSMLTCAAKGEERVAGASEEK